LPVNELKVTRRPSVGKRTRNLSEQGISATIFSEKFGPSTAWFGWINSDWFQLLITAAPAPKQPIPAAETGSQREDARFDRRQKCRDLARG